MKQLRYLIVCFLLLGGIGEVPVVHAESHCCENRDDGMHPAENHPGENHPKAHHPGENHPAESHPGEDHAGENHPDEGHSCDHPCEGCPVNCHCACHGHLTALQHHFLTIHCPYEAPFSYMVYRNNYCFDFHIPTFEPPRFG